MKKKKQEGEEGKPRQDLGGWVRQFHLLQFIEYKGHLEAFTDGRRGKETFDKPASLCRLDWDVEVTRVWNVGVKISSLVQGKFSASYFISSHPVAHYTFSKPPSLLSEPCP